MSQWKDDPPTPTPKGVNQLTESQLRMKKPPLRCSPGKHLLYHPTALHTPLGWHPPIQFKCGTFYELLQVLFWGCVERSVCWQQELWARRPTGGTGQGTAGEPQA